MKDILFSSGVGFGIGALFTIVRLPIPVPNVLRYIIHCVYVCRISGGEILYAMII